MKALLERRLLFVVGKGGVGKTTVAAALALAAADRGRKVLFAELEGEDRLRPLLGLPSDPSSAPVVEEVLPGLYRTSVFGRAALEEYLGLVVPVRRVLRAVFESRLYRYFVAAAPGLKELMTVGKIWYEATQGRWDLVVVDCPATGHSLQYLRMPKVALETFPSGLVHREAARVWEVLRDPERTAVVVVTTAEEMPVNETIEICSHLDSVLGLPRGILVVNRFHEAGIAVRDLETACPSSAASPEEAALVRAVLDRAREIAEWSEWNARHRARLVQALDWPIRTLPMLFREEFGLGDVREIASLLSSQDDSEEVGR
jgi:anion-transporting  ArsA/GET3 family ATPase